ncbi:hypothetical protein DIS24_g5859 [Lasiodiplodia hormozganensis]|uniref:Uncharacterized protein n=1 Tax=Lasiodiplodia hormozganensis TaxID=869390 RepID=A0AA40CWW3_9PEZI|nr:hypothetical protein DIS24_g5859 [Lasiodiplodia hormozganensis]
MTTGTRDSAGPPRPDRRRFFQSCNFRIPNIPCQIFHGARGPAAIVRLQHHLDGIERFSIRARIIREETDAGFVRSPPFIPTNKARESSAHRIVVCLNNRARSLNGKLAAAPPYTKVAALHSLQTYKAIPDFPRTLAEIDELAAAQLTYMLHQLGKEAPKGLTPKRKAFKKVIGLPDVTFVEQ